MATCIFLALEVMDKEWPIWLVLVGLLGLGLVGMVVHELASGSSYADRVEDEGHTLIYEGHDVTRTADIHQPKKVDQPDRNPGGCSDAPP